MKHAILLIWNSSYEYLKKYLNLFDNDFLFYIHIKMSCFFTLEEICHIRCLTNVIQLIEQEDNTKEYGNLLKIEMQLISEIVKNDNIQYVHFLDDTIYPIKKIESIKAFFKNRNSQYIFSKYVAVENVYIKISPYCKSLTLDCLKRIFKNYKCTEVSKKYNDKENCFWISEIEKQTKDIFDLSLCYENPTKPYLEKVTSVTL